MKHIVPQLEFKASLHGDGGVKYAESMANEVDDDESERIGSGRSKDIF